MSASQIDQINQASEQPHTTVSDFSGAEISSPSYPLAPEAGRQEVKRSRAQRLAGFALSLIAAGSGLVALNVDQAHADSRPATAEAEQLVTPDAETDKRLAKQWFTNINNGLSSGDMSFYDGVFAYQEGVGSSGRTSSFAFELQAQAANGLQFEDVKVERASHTGGRTTMLLSAQESQAGQDQKKTYLLVKATEASLDGYYANLIGNWQSIEENEAKSLLSSKAEFKKAVKQMPNELSAEEAASRIDAIMPALPTSDDPLELMQQSAALRECALNNSNERCLEYVVQDVNSELGEAIRNNMAINLVGDKVITDKPYKYSVLQVLSSSFSESQRVIEVESEEIVAGKKSGETYVNRVTFVPKKVMTTSPTTGAVAETNIWVIADQQLVNP